MVMVHFTSNLRRHVDCMSVECTGVTVQDVLDQVFKINERLQTYVLDDQGQLRKHMSVLLDGQTVKDRAKFSDSVHGVKEIWVMQALSGG
jgi:sulfur-carrier protein